MQEIANNPTPEAQRPLGPGHTESPVSPASEPGGRTLETQGQLPTGERLPFTATVSPAETGALELPYDAALRETLEQGPVTATLDTTELTLEQRGETIRASAVGAEGHVQELVGRPDASGNLVLEPLQLAQAEEGDRAGPLQRFAEYALDQTLNFFGGAGREILDQAQGLWNLTSRTAETVTQATLAPLEMAAGAGAGAISALWSDGGAGERAGAALQRELQETRKAWADIGASGERFLELVWNVGIGQVANYRETVVDLAARLQSDALQQGGLSREEVAGAIRAELGENPSYQTTTAILDALTNYRGIVRAAGEGDDAQLAQEIGRSSVRVLDLLAGVVLTNKAATATRAGEAADTGGDALRKADDTSRAGLADEAARRGLTNVNPRVFAVMEELGLSLDSRLYRYTDPQFIDRQSGTLTGNSRSVAIVRDPYTGPEPTPEMRQRLQLPPDGDELIPALMPREYTSELADPGLNTAINPPTNYRQAGDVMVSVTVEDVLRAGGKLYLDDGAAAEMIRPVYITIPEGQRIPYQLETPAGE